MWLSSDQCPSVTLLHPDHSFVHSANAMCVQYDGTELCIGAIELSPCRGTPTIVMLETPREVDPLLNKGRMGR